MTSPFPAQALDQPLPGHPAYPGNPGWPGSPAAFPPPPPRRRTALIIAVVGAALGLVVLAGAATAVYFATRGGTAPAAAERATPTATADGGPKHLRFTASDTVGGWRKADDAGQTDMLAKGLSDKGLKETFGAIYRDQAGHTALLAGGSSTEYGNGREYSQAASLAMGLAMQLANTTTTPTQKPADPGIIGGVAACSPVGDPAAPTTACVWNADDLVLALVFDDLGLDDASGQIHTMLPDLVVYA
ncbi:hypothetical protein [Dactylosporangium sp. NPDC048998]|uniref:hypothetical protein n=1 Tax=Dactylosporangium sp. NPDC048998 TaxID=3363976 RepID=UPI003720B5C3